MRGFCALQLLESQLDDWMDAFHTLATFKQEQLEAADAAADSEREGTLDAVKAAGELLRPDRWNLPWVMLGPGPRAHTTLADICCVLRGCCEHSRFGENERSATACLLGNATKAIGVCVRNVTEFPALQLRLLTVSAMRLLTLSAFMRLMLAAVEAFWHSCPT